MPPESNLNDPALRLGITFCKGSAMKLELDRVDEPEWIADFWTPSMGDFDRIGEYELYIMPGSHCPWPTIGSFIDKDWPGEDALHWKGGRAGHITHDPSSLTLLDTIQSWIETCRDTHSICFEAESSVQSRLPKRVISIDPSDVRNICLLEAVDSKSRDEPYIALSHCWGKTHNILLTKKSINQFKLRIPYDQLSNTFKDAVKLAQGLGVRYLWIDSLCIVQDDREDWEIEAAKMASIYEGAYLVAAATGFPDGNAGFLTAKKPFISQAGFFPDGKPFEIYGRDSLDHAAFSWGMKSAHFEDFINPTSAARLVNPSNYPLFYRAWCFQERALATRILHFTKDEIIFDCLTGINCECGALSNHQGDAFLPPRRILRLGHKHIPVAHDRRFNILQHNSRWSLQTSSQSILHNELWRDIVVSYSAKQITQKTDGLPALAGLAIKLSGELTGRYLAGLWEKDLLNGLRWYPVEKESDEQIDHYTVPSWSWVSVHRGVSWGNESFENDRYFPEVDLTRTECLPSGRNPFGEIKYGYIFMSGHVMTLKCFLSSPGEKAWLRKDGPDFEAHSFQPDNGYQFERLGLTEVICLRLSTKANTVNAYDDDCALVLRKPDPHILSRQPDHVQRSEYVFQRVGYLNVYPSKGWQHSRDSKAVDLYLI
ncbi:heterokaryon incompatibility protein-domain-containing protein [Mariannaea sp. PMI_226]|nr:heterokaryon incompatibility protein-domain-containing protein [Mariannaea sp. PMI_226]